MISGSRQIPLSPFYKFPLRSQLNHRNPWKPDLKTTGKNPGKPSPGRESSDSADFNSSQRSHKTITSRLPDGDLEKFARRFDYDSAFAVQAVCEICNGKLTPLHERGAATMVSSFDVRGDHEHQVHLKCLIHRVAGQPDPKRCSIAECALAVGHNGIMDCFIKGAGNLFEAIRVAKSLIRQERGWDLPRQPLPQQPLPQVALGKRVDDPTASNAAEEKMDEPAGAHVLQLPAENAEQMDLIGELQGPIPIDGIDINVPNMWQEPPQAEEQDGIASPVDPHNPQSVGPGASPVILGAAPAGEPGVEVPLEPLP